jgi:hypothetical protein
VQTTTTTTTTMPEQQTPKQQLLTKAKSSPAVVTGRRATTSAKKSPMLKIRGFITGKSRKERQKEREAATSKAVTKAAIKGAATAKGGAKATVAPTSSSSSTTKSGGGGLLTMLDSKNGMMDADDQSTVYGVDVDEASAAAAPTPAGEAAKANLLAGGDHTDADEEDEEVDLFEAEKAADRKFLLKVVLLLMDSKTRRFELLQLEFDTASATVADVLAQIPVAVTEDCLQEQVYKGITGAAAIIKPPTTVLSEFCEGSDVMVAIADGMTSVECVKLARPILSDPKVMAMVRIFLGPDLRLLLEAVVSVDQHSYPSSSLPLGFFLTAETDGHRCFGVEEGQEECSGVDDDGDQGRRRGTRSKKVGNESSCEGGKAGRYQKGSYRCCSHVGKGYQGHCRVFQSRRFFQNFRVDQGPLRRGYEKVDRYKGYCCRRIHGIGYRFPPHLCATKGCKDREDSRSIEFFFFHLSWRHRPQYPGPCQEGDEEIVHCSHSDPAWCNGRPSGRRQGNGSLPGGSHSGRTSLAAWYGIAQMWACWCCAGDAVCAFGHVQQLGMRECFLGRRKRQGDRLRPRWQGVLAYCGRCFGEKGLPCGRQGMFAGAAFQRQQAVDIERHEDYLGGDLPKGCQSLSLAV